MVAYFWGMTPARTVLALVAQALADGYRARPARRPSAALSLDQFEEQCLRAVTCTVKRVGLAVIVHPRVNRCRVRVLQRVLTGANCHATEKADKPILRNEPRNSCVIAAPPVLQPFAARSNAQDYFRIAGVRTEQRSHQDYDESASVRHLDC
jgi:hypothetical protein